MKLRWMLLFFMLMLAALACSDVYHDPIRVQRVEADLSTPGRTYALVGDEITSAVYETNDYGQHWQRSEYEFSEEARNSYEFRFSSETLYYRNQSLWKYPRSTFRSFFVDDLDYQPPHGVPYDSVSNSAHDNTIYVAMGTQGVLVGPAPGSVSEREWTLTANGIDLLDPIPLTLTDPLKVIGVVLVALLVPPLPLIHAYLLSLVWAYLLPRRLARRYAAYTSGGLSLLAAAGIALWLTNVEIEYGWIVGAMTLITVVSGVGLTFYFANHQNMPSYLRNRTVGVALFASLVVPVGVISVFALWWLIFLIVFGYRAYSDMFHRGIVGEKRKAKNKREQWLIDRLTVETIFIALLMGSGVLLLIIIFITTFSSPVMYIIATGLFIGAVAVFASFIRNYFITESEKLKEIDFADDFDVERLRGDITAATIKWIVFSLGATAVTFMLQLRVSGWFADLLR